jgi:hypothetical protein
MSARALLAFLALSLTGCACCDDAQAPPSTASDAEERAASVQGTVVDANTRAPVAGAEVTAPDGSRARSDDAGRFRIEGLAAGLEGELVAEGPDGRVGRVRLRPLRNGPLEVVVHLRTP